MPLDFEESLSQLVSIPNEPPFDITAAITVTAWIKVESFTRTWQAILTKGDNSWRLHRQSNSNGVTFHLSGVTGGSPGSAGNVNDGAWHHVGGTYDGSTIKVWVDGVALISQAASGSINLGNHLVNIAQNAQQASRWFDGLIDDARVYNRALSDAEMETVFATKGLDGIVDGIVSRWTMNEQAPAVAAVAAGSVKDLRAANDGDPTNSPVYGTGIVGRRRRKVA